MNVKTINSINKTPKTRSFRRSLAIVCAAVIAMLQCAVILTVDDVHATDIAITVTYADQQVTRSVSLNDESDCTLSGGSDGNSVVLSGTSLNSLIGKAGINSSGINSIKVGNRTFSKNQFSDVIIINSIKSGALPSGKGRDDIQGRVYVRNEPNDITDFIYHYDRVGSMFVDKKGTSAIRSIKLNIPDSFEKGQSYDLNPELVGTDEAFYSGSEAQSKFTNNIKIKSDNNTVAKVEGHKVTINNYGKAKITASIGSVVTKPTEIGVIKKTSEDEVKITKNGTLKKGKDYSNSQLKEKLKVTVDGEPLSDDNWDVIKQSTKDGKIHVTIELKNGYEGTFSESFYLSSSSGNSGGGSSWRSRSYNSNGITRSTTNSSLNGTTTGTTVPNVTYAPDRTITVKEVTLGGKIEDQTEQTDPANQGYIDPMEDGSSSEPDMTSENTPMTLGPTAGSAAVAAAACGAGVVGRIRRFKLDTAMAAVEEITTEGE